MPPPPPRPCLPGASPCLLLASGRVLKTHRFILLRPEPSPPPLSPVAPTPVEIAGARRCATAAIDDESSSSRVPPCSSLTTTSTCRRCRARRLHSHQIQ